MNRAHSYSSLATLASCAQKFHLSYGLRLEAPGINIPMQAGSAIDAALNHLYVTAWELDGALARLRESWGDTRPPLGAKHAHLTLGYLEERVRVYMEEREAQPTELEDALADGRVLTEFSGVKHEFEWTNPEGERVTLRGIPDFAIRTTKGTVRPVDVKATTQWVGEHWLLQFRIGHQLRIYSAMLEAANVGRVDGAYINAIHMGPKGLETLEEWRKSKRKSGPSALKSIDFTSEQILEAHAWTRGLEAVEETCERTGLWPRDEKACGNYGGCEYLDLCTAPSEAMRKARIMTSYVRRDER